MIEVKTLDDVRKGDMVLCVRGKAKTFGKVLNLENGSVTYGGHEYLKEAREHGATVCGAGHWSPIQSDLPETNKLRSKLFIVRNGAPKKNIPLSTPRKGNTSFDLMC